MPVCSIYKSTSPCQPQAVISGPLGTSFLLLLTELLSSSLPKSHSIMTHLLHGATSELVHVWPQPPSGFLRIDCSYLLSLVLLCFSKLQTLLPLLLLLLPLLLLLLLLYYYYFYYYHYYYYHHLPYTEHLPCASSLYPFPSLISFTPHVSLWKCPITPVLQARMRPMLLPNHLYSFWSPHSFVDLFCVQERL